MNKAEILKDIDAGGTLLKGLSIHSVIAEPVLVETNKAGDNHYSVNVRKMGDGKSSIFYDKIDFVVLNEGSPEEEAAYLQGDFLKD